MTGLRATAAGVAVAVIAGVAAAAGCSPAGTGGPGRTAPWRAEATWPFALAVRGRDTVVAMGGNRIVTLDTATGRERWRAEVARVTHYEPALDADTVLVSADDRFVAFERGSGARRWEASVGEHAAGTVLTRAGSDAIALVTTERGVVAAFDVRTGQARWSAQVPGDIWAAPAADATAGAGAVLWSAGEEHLHVFDLATGAVRWDSTVEPGASAPVIRNRLVVLGEGNGNFAARVVARDLASGAERWSVPAPASFESGVTPGAAGDDVAVCDHFGTVTLVDARRGTTRWQTPLRMPILDTRVLLTSHAVVIRTYGGKIVVLDRASGRVVRRLGPGGFPVGFGVGGGRLVFAVRLARPDRVESEGLP
ncbi:MAG TPA: PQQ-binding-like beta-propeller repeat protein [Acidimicrobiia bacterium]|nr:PQQ-binding-like beta-propeller repeat protein [Acidimicrobiia bacterium]